MIARGITYFDILQAMHGLSNTFSVLNLVGDDDIGQMTTLVENKDETAKSDEEKKDNEVSGNSVALKNEENQESLLDPSEEYKYPLVWIDLEMTGLDVEVDRILEIACIITDGKLIRSVEGPDLVIKQSKDCLDKMGEWCREHHGASGLTERVLQSTVTEHDAEKQVIEFVKKHVASDTHAPLLAGNSVYVDLVFLKKYMPELAGLFSHVLVDVSSVAALCSRWFPKARKKAPSKEKNHRAMDDIRESIRELKYYKENIFKPMAKSKK